MPVKHKFTRIGRTAAGIHAFDTEARTLEQACDIIERQQNGEKSGATRKGKPKSLRFELSVANARAMMLKRRGKISLAGGFNKCDPKFYSPRQKPPHPFLDLTIEQKRIKAREMAASGCWGIAPVLYRRLAQVFEVTAGQIKVWVSDCSGEL